MTRIAYFDCFSGISGDMCLGALISAGWPAAALESLPGRLALEGVAIAVAPARRGPFAATRVEVRVEREQPHRHLHHVLAILDAGGIEPAVRERAGAVFRRLAEAEAEVHGSTPEQVHFHEVGAADALIDIVGTLEGLVSLGVRRVYSSAPRLGGGSVMSAHGRIPVPAPATLALLRGAPAELGPVQVELTTPTGAALLATLVEDWGAPPAFRLDRVGTGAGARDLAEQPNVLRVLVGDSEGSPGTRRRVAVLETALDDRQPFDRPEGVQGGDALLRERRRWRDIRRHVVRVGIGIGIRAGDVLVGVGVSVGAGGILVAVCVAVRVTVRGNLETVGVTRSAVVGCDLGILVAIDVVVVRIDAPATGQQNDQRDPLHGFSPFACGSRQSTIFWVAAQVKVPSG